MIDSEKFKGIRAITELSPIEIDRITVEVRSKKYTIRQAFDKISELLGRKVGYMYRIKDVLSWSAIINDLANAVHVIAEELAKLGIMPKIYARGKCEGIGEDLDPRAVKLCAYWDKYTDECYREGLYLDEDYEALYGNIIGNRVELRVGSAEGHATEVEFKDNKIFISYYDTDRSVNERMKTDFEICGCECKVSDDGVNCVCDYEGDETLKCIANAIAGATSMDIRIRRGVD